MCSAHYNDHGVTKIGLYFVSTKVDVEFQNVKASTMTEMAQFYHLSKLYQDNFTLTRETS